MAAFKPISTVVCEDIRTEVSRKVILIGAFASHIFVAKFPARLILQAWIQIKFEERGSVELMVRWIAGDQLRAEGTIPLEIDTNGLVQAIAFPKVTMDIMEECDIRIQAKAGGRKWTTLITLPVAINPDLPTASPPPSGQSPPAAQP